MTRREITDEAFESGTVPSVGRKDCGSGGWIRWVDQVAQESGPIRRPRQVAQSCRQKRWQKKWPKEVARSSG